METRLVVYAFRLLLAAVGVAYTALASSLVPFIALRKQWTLRWSCLLSDFSLGVPDTQTPPSTAPFYLVVPTPLPRLRSIDAPSETTPKACAPVLGVLQ